jgi:hypothetical protein
VSRKHYTHIRDGFTRAGFVKDVPGLHGELRFSYRPMLPEQRNAVRRLVSGEKGDKGDVLLRTAIAEHLVDWSATDDEGKDIKVSSEGVRRLPPALYDRLYLIVSGMDASDPEPDATSEEETGYAAALRKAAETGAAVGDVQTVAQQKN